MLEDMLHVFRDLHHKSKWCFQSLISGYKKQEFLSILPSPKTYSFYHWTKEVKHAATEVEHAPALGMLPTKQKLCLHKEKEELIMKHKSLTEKVEIHISARHPFFIMKIIWGLGKREVSSFTSEGHRDNAQKPDHGQCHVSWKASGPKPPSLVNLLSSNTTFPYFIMPRYIL